jgi:Icc-related predicted phosphoesterase
VIRVAAVGDVHAGVDCAERLRAGFSLLAEQADVLLLAGDLTRRGTPEEARAMAAALAPLRLPVVAVLGNHDYHADAAETVVAVMEDIGVTVLEGDSTTLDLGGRTLGIAGVKGFGTGFPGGCGTEFGEPEMKAFVAHSRIRAECLHRALVDLRADVVVALTHYSPTPDTLRGEPPEIHPFLGSFHLAEAIDRAGVVDLALHGHAHLGTEVGLTPGGVPVRNVAQPVLGRSYKIYLLDGDEATGTLVGDAGAISPA